MEVSCDGSERIEIRERSGEERLENSVFWIDGYKRLGMLHFARYGEIVWDFCSQAWTMEEKEDDPLL